MTALRADLKESITQAQRWRASQGTDRQWSTKTKNFWKTEHLQPRYIQPNQLAGLFYLFKFDQAAWQEMFDAGMSFDTLHPNGRSLADELLEHPFSHLLNPIFLTTQENQSPAFELLMFLKEHGLQLNAKFKNQPYYVNLVYHRWSTRDLPLVQRGLVDLERLGLRLDERNQKGNTMLHEAILKGNWVLCEALLSQDASRFGWLGEKQRTAVDFFKRRLAQSNHGQVETHLNLIAPSLLTLAERYLLDKQVPTSPPSLSTAKPGKRI